MDACEIANYFMQQVDEYEYYEEKKISFDFLDLSCQSEFI